MSKLNISQTGYYWLYQSKSRVDLRKVFVFPNGIFVKKPDELDIETLYEQAYEKAEYIGEELPIHLKTTKAGFYWLVDGYGAKHIMKIREDQSNGGWMGEVVGSQYTYRLYQILQAYKAVRIEWFAPFEEDYFRSNLRS